jgi:hypothetical protein
MKRMSLKMSLIAAALLSTTAMAAADSFAEREFPELKKAKPVAAAPLDLAKPAHAQAEAAPVAKTPMRVIPLPTQSTAAKVAPPAPQVDAGADKSIALAPAAEPKSRAHGRVHARAERKTVHAHARTRATTAKTVAFTVDGGRPASMKGHPILGYHDANPAPSAYADATGLNGAPAFRAVDQQQSFAKNCGYVYHRFFDENAAAVDRPVRVCN